VADDLRAGESVLLHCAAGIGRTGTAAACVLKSLGLTRDEALERVRAAGSDPQSAAQSGLIDAF
jgi:protein-tyrosine phosphatase